jgi:hypothetical protein
MRFTSLFAAALLVSVAAPAFAEDAAPAADDSVTFELSDEQDTALWCFGAYTVSAEHYKQTGEAEQEATATANADALATKAAALLVADNVLDEEFARLGAEYTTKAIDQIVNKKEDPSYTQEQCDAFLAAE